jgi:hypothetical protein
MDAELKKKWVEALRSGEYTQTQGHLKSSEGFCCLGVLCEVNSIKYIETDVFGDGPNSGAYIYIRDIVGSDASDTCINLNDDGKSFEEIADWIEANL